MTRGKKFEGVWSTGKGVYIVNSFAFNAADLPADAIKHDGMVWYYSFSDETITLVTYFPHNRRRGRGALPKYGDLIFDGPDNVTVTPWGTLVLAEDGVGSHVLSAVPGGPTYAVARNQLVIGTTTALRRTRSSPDRPSRGRQGAVRQHPGPGHHPGHHRPLGDTWTEPQHVDAPAPRVRAGASPRPRTFVDGGPGGPPDPLCRRSHVDV